MPLKAAELKSLKGLLRNVQECLEDARSLAQSGSDIKQAARIKNISRRIDDEIDVTNRKLADAERLEGRSGK
jgi:hypothetical protein